VVTSVSLLLVGEGPAVCLLDRCLLGLETLYLSARTCWW
jgi:hypothetical protein